MSYNYQRERPSLFTEAGQILFLKIRDKTKHLLQTAGAARCQEMIAGNAGDSWEMLACVDRLVELEEIREITPSTVMAQHRVFVTK